LGVLNEGLPSHSKSVLVSGWDTKMNFEFYDHRTTLNMQKRKKKHALSHGRPPTLERPNTSLPSRATRTIIRTHHNLQKALAQAVKSGDTAKAEQIKNQIEEQGGLELYQKASILGQSNSRGGDSSKILMQWLDEESIKAPTKRKYEMLEVGALSTTNACSKSGLFSVKGIDLNSQDSKIEEQDFMERPLPSSDTDRFDLISLSLVLNYVPDAVGRGEMLKRTTQFLKVQNELPGVFPALFLVLPAPCVTNSRYMTEELLDSIMESLGYSKLKQKISSKLVYSLWRHSTDNIIKTKTFTKAEIHPGKGRNNFSIIMR
jgi:25S rRNA (adenine2142-N1)-methyltransferase